MQEVRPEFDEQPWPIGNALTQHLDTEVIGLEEQAIAIPCTVG
jgi:hypothetical protein